MANVLSAVNERRLRPIYEQLDNGNNKKALHEAEKVLKKQKDLTAAKVLKTIALHRMGKDRDAFALSEEIVAQEPTDENSLQGLSLYFKEIRKTELICGLYEAAVKHCPSNEEYLTHLFMSYVRHENFQQMQKVAMNLYKRHPKNPYLFWAIMSIVLQAQYSGDEKLAKTMYLPLALKMIEKHVENGKIEAEAEVRLYLLILDLAGKYEKVIEVLDGSLGEKVISELRGRENSLLNAQEKSNLWLEVNKKNKKLLKENPDVWNYALGYLSSFFKIFDRTSLSANQNNDEQNEDNMRPDEPDRLLSHAFQFIMNLVKNENSVIEGKRRGPYLLRLEMLKRLKDFGDDSQGSPWQLILEYALDFSTKPCCFHDLVPYFGLLPEKDVDKFLADLYEQQASFTYNDLNGECSPALKREINRRKENELQRHIFTIEATRFLSKHESLWNEEKLTLASDYVRRHKNGIQYSNDRPDTDCKVADAYCLFAVRLLLDVYLDTEDTALLWRCVSILEYGLTLSEYNHEMKFMLIRIYCKLGLFTPCKRLFDSLEIKHIQHETLGYVVCQHMVALGHYDTASLLFQLTRGFYFSNEKECVECLIACFRNGTFYKISELVEFRKKIKCSFHAALIKTEHALMDFLVQADIDRSPSASFYLSTVNLSRINFDSLTDNRDFSLVTDINPENKRLTQELVEQSFTEEKNWLLFRELLLRSLHLLLSQATRLTPSQNGYSFEKDVSRDLDGFLQELNQFCEQRPKDPPNYPFNGPHVSRLHLSFEAQYPQTSLLLFKYCKGLYSNVGRDANEQSNFTHYLTSVVSNISDFLKSCCDGILLEPKSDDYSNEVGSDTILSQTIPDSLLSIRPSVIERLVLCVEMFSIVTLLLTNLQSIIGETKAEVNRKRKKKKNKQAVEQPTQCEWVTGFHDGVCSLVDLGGSIVAAIKQLKADADSMLLDLAKSKLVEKDITKRRTLSDIPEIPPSMPEQPNLTENMGPGGERMKPTSQDKATKPCEVPSIVKDAAIQETAPADPSNSKKEDTSNLKDNTNQALKSMQSLSLTEEITASNSAFYNQLEAKTDAQFEKIVRTTSESIRTSCEQILAVVQGRMKSLSRVRELPWFQTISRSRNDKSI